MAISFFPRVVKFFDLFSAQNTLLLESAQLLNDIFATRDGVSEKCGKIVTNELAGNDVSREIARALALTFITPIDREDIHAINVAQESALNSIRAISTRIGLYHFDHVKPGAKMLVEHLLSMHVEISAMVDALKTRGVVDENAGRVKNQKVDADTLMLVSLGEVYDSHPEGSTDFLDMIKWSHIYDRIETALSDTENLANIIEGVSLKNA